jgi:ABC-2 type transport system ATP-binding protein
MTASAVEVEGLCVSRGGREVLHDIGVALPAGGVTGLLGPSGSGKTTFMRALVGVQAGVSGRVTLLGEPAGGAGLRHKIGYVTQSPAVYGDLSVRANLEYFAAVLDADRTRVTEVLRDVDLTKNAERLVATLSGGERARVSLAAALIGRPAVLVLDEPTVGLDPVLRRDLWGMFAGLATGGTTLIVSSHVMDEARRCDRLLLLLGGRLVADATLPDLLRQTRTTDVEDAFLVLATSAQEAAS